MPSPSLAFDIRTAPFSRRGSWLALSPVTGLHRTEADLHVVDHRQGMHPVLRLQTVGTDAIIEATPSLLRWSTPTGAVEAVFAGPDTVRFRGSGTGFRFSAASEELTPFSGEYLFTDPVDGAVVVTSYETGLRYRLTVVAGSAQVVGGEALGAAIRSVTLSATEAWEVELDCRQPGGAPAVAARPAFDEVVAAVREELDAFVGGFNGDPVDAAAAAVLWAATVAPGGFVGREAVLMSKHWMDKVWSWDHCFTALALAPVAPERALDQFLLPFDHQAPDGSLPDSVTYAEILRNFVKPPIHGWAFRRLREQLPRPMRHDELTAVHDRLAAWTTYWLEHRRPAGSAIPLYQHGNDSGWDNSTVFDGGGLVASPDLAALLLIQLDVLADLADELGRVATAWRLERAALHAALLETWDGSRFTPRRADGTEVTADSLLTLVPLVAAPLLPDEVVQVLVTSLDRHRTRWGLATEPVDSPAYEPDGYWRGPIWAPPTVLIEDGLRAAGRTEDAARIRAAFFDLTSRNGFAENFDAVTGAGLRDRAYTWTAAAHLVLRRAEAAASAGRAAA